MKISVVVVNSGRHQYFDQALKSLFKAQQVEPSFEYENIFVFNGVEPFKQVECITLTQKVYPSKARNIALKHCHGDWIYFLDDDAFISENFFSIFKEIIETQKALVIGGPNITPPKSSLFQTLCGEALGSLWGAGPSAKRYSKKFTQGLCSDSALILCNLFVHKSCFVDSKFKENLVCGEENLFLTRLFKQGIRFFYSPYLFVFHHRRKTFMSFCLQIFKYGIGRGQNIANKGYCHLFNLIPVALFLVFIALFFISIKMAILLLAIYILLNIIFSIRNNLIKTLNLFFIYPAIHLFYVLGVFEGVFKIFNFKRLVFRSDKVDLAFKKN